MIKDFITWVNGENNTRSFHYSNNEFCLGASFYREFYGLNNVRFSSRYVYIDNKEELIPDWLVCIIQAVFVGNTTTNIARVKQYIRERDLQYKEI